MNLGSCENADKFIFESPVCSASSSDYLSVKSVVIEVTWQFQMNKISLVKSHLNATSKVFTAARLCKIGNLQYFLKMIQIFSSGVFWKGC